MSKSDNTHPSSVQARDLTRDGYTVHKCTKRRGQARSRAENRTADIWLSVLVADSSRVTAARLEATQSRMQSRTQVQPDMPTYLVVKRRPNTTTAAVLRRLRESFGEVELLPTPKWPVAVKHDCNEQNCTRVLRHFGGERHVHGHAKEERKLRRRQLRQRERVALYRTRHGFTTEFDVLPRWLDKHCTVAESGRFS